jgi:hypothetical protein
MTSLLFGDRLFVMKLDREEIFRILKSHRTALNQFGVRGLALFGSFARGENSEESDLDFLVDLEKRSFDAYMGLKEYLETLFGRRIDLVLTHTIKPRLRNAILQEAVHAPGL